MNKILNLENFLWLAGVGHFGILIASALVPKVLGWKSSLQSLPPFLRRLFWVYGAFIVLTIAGMGALTLLNARAMAAGEPAARSISGFIAVFWSARLMVQFFVFDARPYLTSRWLHVGYHSLTIAFVALVAIYAFATLRPGIS